MKYNVNIKDFGRVLTHRPTLIKKVPSLDADSVASLLGYTRAIFEYLPREVQASVKVVRAFIFETPEEIDSNTSNYSRHFSLNLIPFTALKQLTEKERIRLIQRSHSGVFVLKLPEPTYNEWLEAAECGISLDEIPKAYYGRKTLFKAMARHYKKTNYVLNWNIPEEFWGTDEDKANKDIVELLNISKRTIFVIPPKRITNDHLVAAFQSGDISLAEDDFADLPASSWDKTTAILALKANPDNIQTIPLQFLSEDIAIACVDAEVSLEIIPPSLVTRLVRLHSVAFDNTATRVTSRGTCSYSYNTLEINYTGQNRPQLYKDLQDVTFQADVARMGGKNAIDNICEFIKPENRVEILSACPAYLKYIPKLEQADEIIDAFLDSATAETIDDMASHINMGKIKKGHAPLLIGCKSNLILTAIEKKLNPTQRKKGLVKTFDKVSHAKQGTNTIEINVPPTEFARIREEINKNNL